MLDYLRKKSSHWMSIFIIGAIALVFVFWGIGGQNTGDNYNILLDEESVSILTYLELKRTSIDRIREQSPELDSRTTELLGGQTAINTLIQRHILKKLANSFGIIVPKEAIINTITSDETFHENGRFNKELYVKMVENYTGNPVSAYEADVASDLLLQRASSLISNLDFVPTDFLLDEYHLTEDQIAVSYVYFPQTAFTEDLSPTDEEVQIYYNQNLEEFRVPAEIQVQYVLFRPSDYLSKVEITEAQIEDLYAEEQNSLTKPASAQVSHIHLRFPRFTPTVEQKAAVYIQAQEILDRLKTEDFATVAEEVSNDTQTAPQGGDLGEITPGTMLAEFDQAVFLEGGPPLNEVIGPVETLFGYHLIKVRSYNPPDTQNLEDVRENLTDTLTKRQARRLAINALEDLLERAVRQNSNDLGAIASSMGLEATTSSFFTATDPPDFFAGDTKAVEQALSQPVGLIADPVDTPDFFAVYVPVERRESYIPPLANIQKTVREGWIRKVSTQKAQEAATNFIREAKSKGFASAQNDLAPGSFDAGQTPFYSRLRFVLSAPAPIIFADQSALFEAVFSIKNPLDVAPKPIQLDVPGFLGYLVISLNNTQAASEDIFQDNIASLRSSVGPQSASAALNFWLNSQMSTVQTHIPLEVERELQGDTSGG